MPQLQVPSTLEPSSAQHALQGSTAHPWDARVLYALLEHFQRRQGATSVQHALPEHIRKCQMLAAARFASDAHQEALRMP
jgi:hypothetical protein